MNTRAYLSQIQRLDRMIANKTREIQNLEDKATSLSVSTDKENVKSSGSKDKMAIFASMAAEQSMKRDKLVENRTLIVNQIDGLKNLTSYDILTMFYVLNASVKEIADTLGYSESNVKKLKHKAMIEFENSYGKSYLKLKKCAYEI